MERLPSFYEEEEDDDDHLHHQQQQQEEQQHGMLSCWGKLKHVFRWRRLRRHVRRRSRVPVKRGSFRYDPLSYSQNFDDGVKVEDEENSSRGFSSRFVAFNATTSIKQDGGVRGTPTKHNSRDGKAWPNAFGMVCISESEHGTS